MITLGSEDEVRALLVILRAINLFLDELEQLDLSDLPGLELSAPYEAPSLSRALRLLRDREPHG
jgi:hypothetical protein